MSLRSNVTMTCDECGEKKDGDYGRWAPAPDYLRAMLVCYDCAEYVRTFATKQEAIDARAKLIAPDPHDACKETIKARERSITDLRYRVREVERDYVDLMRERDEWKAKAEALEQDKAAYDGLMKWWYDEAQKLERATHYCCYHMRWETQRGEEI